ncbi:M23 family metallopeptidase [Pseudothauera nasutitermitis]|uniref:M23 family metallopeptidase n=1 Tax=Pseudothauera nasutitermitis TaxID=2565930 RepID=UPI001E425961|nr:M23 family metallopeptidase [Pseudothauera nasutitermitis]
MLTVSTRSVLVFGCLLATVAVAAGIALGYRMAQAPVPEAEIAVAETAVPLTLDQPEGRALVDRVGELSGRLIRLESEAVMLAKRVGVLKEFEERVDAAAGDKKVPAADTTGKAAVAPSGGPLVPPLGQTIGDAAEQSVEAALRDDFGTGLSELERHLDRIDAAFALVERVTTERNLENMAFPSRIPVEGRPITSGFGNRLDPFTRRLARHTGVDFPAPPGTPILASAGGKVKYAGYNRDYGYMIEIDHGNGLITRYAHASRLLVKTGELIMPQQRIALVGSTGRSTGPHLHFEVIRAGSYVDPRLYLARSGS